MLFVLFLPPQTVGVQTHWVFPAIAPQPQAGNLWKIARQVGAKKVVSFAAPFRLSVNRTLTDGTEQLLLSLQERTWSGNLPMTSLDHSFQEKSTFSERTLSDASEHFCSDVLC